MEEDMDYSDTQSPIDQSQMHDDTSSTQENTVDSTVDTEQKGEQGNMYNWRISLKSKFFRIYCTKHFNFQ